MRGGDKSDYCLSSLVACVSTDRAKQNKTPDKAQSSARPVPRLVPDSESEEMEFQFWQSTEDKKEEEEEAQTSWKPVK